MINDFPAANIYFGKNKLRFRNRCVFKRILQYFIFVTTKIGLELYDPLNVTDKTITATIPSETHTQVLKEMKILAKIGKACLHSCQVFRSSLYYLWWLTLMQEKFGSLTFLQTSLNSSLSLIGPLRSPGLPQKSLLLLILWDTLDPPPRPPGTLRAYPLSPLRPCRPTK